MSLIKGVTLGQYIPADSFFHKLDPRCKLLVTVLSMILIFMSGNFPAMAIWAFFIIFIAKKSQIPAKALMRSAKPILVLVFYIATSHFFTGGNNIIFSIGPLKASAEGTVTAFQIGLRLYLLVYSLPCSLSQQAHLNFLMVWKQLLALSHVFGFPAHEVADDDDSPKIYPDSI